jgi:hypothetical protein
VRVDYDHPFGLLRDVLVTDLQASDAAKTRPIMTLMNPRCADCGLPLGFDALAPRVQPGGDLYDRRFSWPRRQW